MDSTRMLDILDAVPAVQHTEICNDVAEKFRALPSVPGFAVLNDGLPVGVIGRDDLIIKMAAQYGHAVYAKRPVSELMDIHPLIVDVTADVDHVEQQIAEQYSHALSTGFIITQGGTYLGMGTAIALLRKSVDQSRYRNAKLEAASAQARHANTVKSQFLASMSHELRTPMNAIIGFAELISTEAYGPISPPRYLEYTNDILDSGRHLLALINDILDMSKIEAGRYTLDLVEVDVRGILKSTLKMCQPLADQKDVTLRIEQAGQDFSILGDERAMKQMMVNLVSNGVKYNKVGGEVVVSMIVDQIGGLSLTVRDTGIGIAEGDLQRVLEPFAQARSRIDNKTEGTGLGLSIVASLAELHGAEFKLESELDVGSEAKMYFPPERVTLYPASMEAGITPPRAEVISAA
ncbi:hypothetical protein GUA87_01250 [Sneathiella sp. P13V-1]|uniref:sensor histidine kinase n=1 Tax=Sneathiella sp. P13V-1 TaxID=2697366 RepID=UPI00187B46FE|nr:ATP-binding protein [Sneathiella sp. P13V-1]MBE7635455.1 hypothetical protein [Sneathiella sp. P13V-1]